MATTTVEPETAVPDAVAEDNQRTGKATPVGPSKYVVLRQDADDAWEELGVVEALGPDAARTAAVKEHNLDPEGLTLVAVSLRFWKPKTGVVQHRDPEIIFS